MEEIPSLAAQSLPPHTSHSGTCGAFAPSETVLVHASLGVGAEDWNPRFSYQSVEMLTLLCLVGCGIFGILVSSV